MKNILLIRTSTVRQEVESQKKELIDYVKSHNLEEIVVVGGAGASAIKLDEQYVANIQKVYDIMEKGDTVWAWSIDRIGRNEEVLMQFKNKLVRSGVNLIIKNPSLKLLEDDGKVNAGIELAFALFATMSKQEMENKKERFSRAKKRNREEGRYNGGKVTFGYAVRSDGYYEIDTENSKVVAEIFKRYLQPNASCHSLAKDYHDKLLQKNLRNTERRINAILKNRDYMGEFCYPPIVSRETFQLVQQKLKDFRVLPRHRYSDTVYWCQGALFERSEDGELHRMRVKKSEASYVSYTERLSININALDSLVYTLLSDLFKTYDNSSILKEIRSQNEENRAKRKHIQSLIDDVLQKDAELDEKYFVTGSIGRNYPVLKKKLLLKLEALKHELSSIVDIPEEFEKPTLDGLDKLQIKGVFEKYVNAIYAMKLDKWTSKIDIITSIGNTRPLIYNRKDYSYRFTDSTEWVSINIIRQIKGRKRIYS